MDGAANLSVERKAVGAFQRPVHGVPLVAAVTGRNGVEQGAQAIGLIEHGGLLVALGEDLGVDEAFLIHANHELEILAVILMLEIHAQITGLGINVHHVVVRAAGAQAEGAIEIVVHVANAGQHGDLVLLAVLVPVAVADGSHDGLEVLQRLGVLHADLVHGLLVEPQLGGGAHLSAQDNLRQTPDLAVDAGHSAGDGGLGGVQLPEVGSVLLQIGAQIDDDAFVAVGRQIAVAQLAAQNDVGHLLAGRDHAGQRFLEHFAVHVVPFDGHAGHLFIGRQAGDVAKVLLRIVGLNLRHNLEGGGFRDDGGGERRAAKADQQRYDRSQDSVEFHGMTSLFIFMGIRPQSTRFFGG